MARPLPRRATELTRLARDYELEVDPDAMVGDLPVGLQQRVEILKALFKGAETLILDEPTGVLTPDEADHLFRILGQLRDQGKTVILITHKLREIMAITDHVSVMRRGELVATKETKTHLRRRTGGIDGGPPRAAAREKGKAKPGEVVLDVKNLTWKDHKGMARVDNVSFNVRTGEIVGIAGVSGNGQSELLELIAGITRPTSGEIIFEGKDIGILGDPAPCARGGSCPCAGRPPASRPHFIFRCVGIQHPRLALRRSLWAKASGLTARRWSTRCQGRDGGISMCVPPIRFSRAPSSPAAISRKSFSPARSSAIPDLLIVGQPTRGVDIGAIEFIHKRLIALRDQGKAILLVSVELDEIRSLSDRILVMFAGRIMGERESSADERELGLLMAGVSKDAA